MENVENSSPHTLRNEPPACESRGIFDGISSEVQRKPAATAVPGNKFARQLALSSQSLVPEISLPQPSKVSNLTSS